MMKLTPLTAALAASLTLTFSACTQESSDTATPTETVTGAEVLPTATAEPVSLSIADKVSSGTYVMDPTHGYVTFTYSHVGFSNPQLRFRTIDASAEIDADTPANSTIDVTIEANSIDSGVDVFDGHLNSTDWFDTELFDTITFTSTGLDQADGTTGTMTGDLTIKGITQSVTLDITLIGAGEHPLHKKETVGVEARGTVLRSDFGLGAYAPAVSDEVSITISGEFNKAE